jgi:hypothetical protein
LALVSCIRRSELGDLLRRQLDYFFRLCRSLFHDAPNDTSAGLARCFAEAVSAREFVDPSTAQLKARVADGVRHAKSAAPESSYR